MKKRIEAYIPSAIDAVKKKLLADEETDKIDNKYNGYISSFGAAVISSGMLATITFFKKDSGHQKILQLIHEIVSEGNSSVDLDTYYTHGNRELNAHKIMDAATAIKLAIRTFKIDK